MVIPFLFIALFGLIWGSFLNVLIDRLPKGENVLWGRSRCDHCKRNLRWYELIPVFSFIFQKGRCRRCKRILSWQYPIIELSTALGFVGIAFVLSFPLVIIGWVLFASFLVIFVADIKYQIIPDSMIVMSLLGSLMWLWMAEPYQHYFNHLISMMGIFGFFLALWVLTKRRGIGLGDVKLSIVLGLLLGYPQIIMAMYIAFLTGAFVGVILIIGGNKSLKSKIAFGPFLIFGTVAVLLFSPFFDQLWRGIF